MVLATNVLGGAKAGGYTEGAHVYNDANISITNITNMYLTFNQERWDTDAIHSLVSNTTRLTCKTAGKYLAWAAITIEANTTGVRTFYLIRNRTSYVGINKRNASSTGVTTGTITALVDLSVNDYIEIHLWQNSGVNLYALGLAEYGLEFGMQRIG